ncbi:MAG TPA: HU family DNA-binding protein [Oligoflexia bacterium]|nr:HU family DNA-binding protein [Oligoflexia bacterium]HMP47859.1 HU family DNA-binding protein [Oligoflexia bacterium]
MATKKASAKKAPAKKKAVAKKPAAKKAPAKKAAPKKKPASKKAAPKKGATKKAAPKKTKAAKKTATKKVAAPKVVAPKRPLVVEPKKPALIVPKNSKTLQYTQSELLDSLASYCGFEKRKGAKEFYDSFSGMLQAALKSGYKLMLPGLGKLQVRKTKPRMGINPKTQERIKIPAKRKVAFTPSKVLKEAVL